MVRGRLGDGGGTKDARSGSCVTSRRRTRVNAPVVRGGGEAFSFCDRKIGRGNGRRMEGPGRGAKFTHEKAPGRESPHRGRASTDSPSRRDARLANRRRDAHS